MVKVRKTFSKKKSSVKRGKKKIWEKFKKHQIKEEKLQKCFEILKKNSRNTKKIVKKRKALNKV